MSYGRKTHVDDWRPQYDCQLQHGYSCLLTWPMDSMYIQFFHKVSFTYKVLWAISHPLTLTAVFNKHFEVDFFITFNFLFLSRKLQHQSTHN